MSKRYHRAGKVLGLAAYMALLTSVIPVVAQTGSVQSTTLAEKKDETEPDVTAVYGIVADDYLLPGEMVVAKELDPQKVGHQIRPAFNLPDTFYIIGVPVFFYLFFRIMITFLQ